MRIRLRGLKRYHIIYQRSNGERALFSSVGGNEAQAKAQLLRVYPDAMVQTISGNKIRERNADPAHSGWWLVAGIIVVMWLGYMSAHEAPPPEPDCYCDCTDDILH